MPSQSEGPSQAPTAVAVEHVPIQALLKNEIVHIRRGEYPAEWNPCCGNGISGDSIRQTPEPMHKIRIYHFDRSAVHILDLDSVIKLAFCIKKRRLLERITIASTSCHKMASSTPMRRQLVINAKKLLLSVPVYQLLVGVFRVWV